MDQKRVILNQDDSPSHKRKRSHNGRSYLQGGKLRLAAMMYWGMWLYLLMILAAVYFFYVSAKPDPRIGKIIILSIFGFVAFFLFYLHTKSHLNCPLCFGPLLKDNGCRKHRKAERYLLFSYLASQAIKICLSGKFRCMYCGELFKSSKEHSRRHRRHAQDTHEQQGPS